MEPVLMSDPLYDEISKRIRMSYPTACILFIDKLVNIFLEEEQSKIQGIVKKQLFHGTPEQNVDSIIRNGFKCEMNKRAAYGKGTYFSEYASCSIKYASGFNDIVYMFLCDVLVDSPHTTTISGSDIYVINNDYAGIPKYLIAFYPVNVL